MIHLVGRTKNKTPIYVDLVTSAAAKHISRQPHLLALAAEALPKITLTLDKPLTNIEVDLQRDIGYDFVVKTTPADVVFYVQLVRDQTYTRFTKHSKPSVTSRLSLILERGPDARSYHLQGIWIGQFTPPRPGGSDETTDSKAYWSDHAVVFENQPMQSQTITKTCPY